jgi:two-component system chemotaxis response regulator CheY
MGILLIVDDSKTIQKQITIFSQKHYPDLKVVTASSAEEALKVIPSIIKDIKVAIFDFNMEGMTGLELIEKVKDVIPTNKIILCTANIQEAIKSKATSTGVHFKEKPLTIENFKPTVDEVLKGSVA